MPCLSKILFLCSHFLQSVFLSYTSSLMPKTSDELPILTLYFLCLLVVNTVSILATLLVLKTFKYSAKSDCPEPPRVLQTIRDIFGPKLKPPVGVLEERNADNPHTLDVTKPNTPSMSTRRAGSFRALSQKLAQVSTLGWFRARDAESKGLKHKNPNKVAPEKSASERAPVSGTILVNPLDISESKFSGPIRVPFSECTLVDLSDEKVCNRLSRSCSENVHDKESCLEKGSFNPKEEADLCQSDGNIMYDNGITNNYNRGANWADVVASNLHTIGNKNKNSCPLAWDVASWSNTAGINSSHLVVGGDTSDKHSDDDYTLEWLSISRALDKMFFLLFNLLIGAVTLFFFLKVL